MMKKSVAGYLYENDYIYLFFLPFIEISLDRDCYIRGHWSADNSLC